MSSPTISLHFGLIFMCVISPLSLSFGSKCPVSSRSSLAPDVMVQMSLTESKHSGQGSLPGAALPGSPAGAPGPGTQKVGRPEAAERPASCSALLPIGRKGCPSCPQGRGSQGSGSEAARPVCPAGAPSSLRGEGAPGARPAQAVGLGEGGLWPGGEGEGGGGGLSHGTRAPPPLPWAPGAFLRAALPKSWPRGPAPGRRPQ